MVMTIEKFLDTCMNITLAKKSDVDSFVNTLIVSNSDEAINTNAVVSSALAEIGSKKLNFGVKVKFDNLSKRHKDYLYARASLMFDHKTGAPICVCGNLAKDTWEQTVANNSGISSGWKITAVELHYTHDIRREVEESSHNVSSLKKFPELKIGNYYHLPAFSKKSTIYVLKNIQKPINKRISKFQINVVINDKNSFCIHSFCVIDGINGDVLPYMAEKLRYSWNRSKNNFMFYDKFDYCAGVYDKMIYFDHKYLSGNLQFDFKGTIDSALLKKKKIANVKTHEMFGIQLAHNE